MQSYSSSNDWTNGVRKQLLHQGDLSRGRYGGYYLTAQGEARVLRELSRFAGNPGSLLLLEQWFAERFGIELH